MLLNLIGTAALIILFHGGWLAIYRDIRDGERLSVWMPGLSFVVVLVTLVLVAIWRR